MATQKFLDKDGLVKLVANTKTYVSDQLKTKLASYVTTTSLNDKLDGYQLSITSDTNINMGVLNANSGTIENDLVVKGKLKTGDSTDGTYITEKYLSLLLDNDINNAISDSKEYTDQEINTLKDEIDKLSVGSVSYLGTVSTQNELNNLNPKKAGDFCRVSANFGSFHSGDLLICKTIATSSTAAVWDVIHGEMDSNTWLSNSKTVDGYVLKGKDNPNKVWKTDAEGNPGWMTDENTTYSVATATADGLMSKGMYSKLDGIASGATNVTSTTVGNWGYTKNTGTVTGIKVSSTSTLNPSSGVVDMSSTLNAKQNSNVTITDFQSNTVTGCIVEALSKAKTYADGIKPDIDAIPVDKVAALFTEQA